MFEKIISKNPGDDSATAGSPQPPRAPAPATKADSPSRARSSSGQRNVLLPDVEIKGKVRFQNDLIVDGKIEGEIVSDGSLTIGENAKIKAEIRTSSVIVYGKVHGNITVTDRIELRKDAEVIGDIKAQVLTMEAGAIFVGTSTVGARPDSGSAQAPVKRDQAAAQKPASNQPSSNQPSSANRPAPTKPGDPKAGPDKVASAS